jgi:hypothetical protein
VRLAEYFRSGLRERAWERYAVLLRKWPISHKADLYAHAARAFDPSLPDAGRRGAFEYVYDSLRGYWQIFRPAKPHQYWDAATVFRVLSTELGALSRPSGVTLATVAPATHGGELLRGIERMRGVKRISGFPEMAASKFLHFLNPHLFPIYDNQFVWKRVFRAFRGDYDSFLREAGLPRADSPQFLANYVLWAGSIIQQAPTDFMPAFADWAQNRLREEGAGGTQLCWARYYATAFEFTSIGAADAELADG